MIIELKVSDSSRVSKHRVTSFWTTQKQNAHDSESLRISKPDDFRCLSLVRYLKCQFCEVSRKEPLKLAPISRTMVCVCKFMQKRNIPLHGQFRHALVRLRVGNYLWWRVRGSSAFLLYDQAREDTCCRDGNGYLQIEFVISLSLEFHIFVLSQEGE